eukprot:TRINITY_DN37645_c0_g1_i1.p1 TRINITY_DN37645_c0_g1~~TRINITY_DN37645_c0_g1_i1.p1  ORF type:complete len:244 (+),score=43.50 TRINITY_DN37645_c0_g1_i1:379-1110(+)
MASAYTCGYRCCFATLFSSPETTLFTSYPQLPFKKKLRMLSPSKGFRAPKRSGSAINPQRHSPSSTLMSADVPLKHELLTVGDFMTKRETLVTVRPTTLVDEALEALVTNRITGLPVVDNDWTLVGVVSDYDLLALDSISGAGRAEAGFFPQVESTWKAFNQLRKLLNKTNGKTVAEVMTPSPIVVRETTNLEDAARLLLETKYRRLPVVDSSGKLVGILTRGNVIRAALEMKRHAQQEDAQT